MRFRDIKKSEELLRLHGYGAPDPAAVVLDVEIKAARRLRRAQERHARKLVSLPAGEFLASPEGGLKRGPKPDLDRDKCEHGWHTQLTRRESLQLEQMRRRLAPKLTRSVFVRWIVCEFLEKTRRKDCPTASFSIDLDCVDYRCKRGGRPPRSGGALCA